MSLSLVLSELRSELGDDAVSTDENDLDACAVDAWPLAAKWAQQDWRPHRPDAVVRVRGIDEVCAVLRSAYAAGIPVTARALGSSVTGQPLPSQGGIVLDLQGLVGPPSLDEKNLVVTAPAGCRGSDLERFLNDRGLTLGHSPQSLFRSSIGGWLATRASGQFSSRYGGIEDLVVGFEAVLADAERIRLHSMPRSAVGPDLRSLFIGAEGTMGIVTEVTLKVFPVPAFRTVEAFKLDHVQQGLDVMRLAMRTGLHPFLLRLYDEDESGQVILDDSFGGCLLLTGCEGVEAVAAAEQAELHAIATLCGGVPLGSEPVDAWLPQRFDFSGIESAVETVGGYAETIEVAHSWTCINDLYRVLKTELAPHADRVLAHFSHAYPQGTSLYLILTGSTMNDAQATARLERIWETAMTHTVRHGGVLSHHHGVGLARLPYLSQALPDSLPLLQRVKSALDPAGVLNPGKLLLNRPDGQTMPYVTATTIDGAVGRDGSPIGETQ